MSANADKPVLLAKSDAAELSLSIVGEHGRAAALAADQLAGVMRDQLGTRLRVDDVPADDVTPCIIAAVMPCAGIMSDLLCRADVPCTADGRIAGLADMPNGDQGFFVMRMPPGADGRCSVALFANTELGLRNALITVGDRLYRDGGNNLVLDPIDGVHAPAFESRHIKTDAMYGGPFWSEFGYWDHATAGGVAEFCDWLASFRITDYNLLAFVRGWGATWQSDRYPSLSIPAHPNVKQEFYPALIERLHEWGVKVWASDICMASGYTMEVNTCREMLSPCADPAKLLPFEAGKGVFEFILKDPHAIACLSHPSAASFYAAQVDEILARYPALDGLDFHVGHAFPNKICRCSACRDFRGNRNAVYRAFARVYETAMQRNPNVALKMPYKMFGDATRAVVEHWEEFPNLQFFCWLRWMYSLVDAGDRTDAPVRIGHEDGAGGLEATNGHDPNRTLRDIRDCDRDFEPWLPIYVAKTLHAGMTSFSWEPALQREFEHMFFLYSQVTWEPDLAWSEFARRYVMRSERRLDTDLIEAYRLALELNGDMTAWGFHPRALAAQGVSQDAAGLQAPDAQEKIAALAELVSGLGIQESEHSEPPAVFDLRRSLARSLARMQSGSGLELWH